MGNEKDIANMQDADRVVRGIDQTVDSVSVDVGDSLGDALTQVPKYGIDPNLPSTQQVEQALHSIHSQISSVCEALGLPKPPSWT